VAVRAAGVWKSTSTIVLLQPAGIRGGAMCRLDASILFRRLLLFIATSAIGICEGALCRTVEMYKMYDSWFEGVI
jgi:hypothetical protein